MHPSVCSSENSFQNVLLYELCHQLKARDRFRQLTKIKKRRNSTSVALRIKQAVRQTLNMILRGL